MNQHKRAELLMDEHAHQADIHDILIRIHTTLEELLAEVKHIRAALVPTPAYSAVGDAFDQEPDVDDKPPDYSPPGSGAVIVGWP